MMNQTKKFQIDLIADMAYLLKQICFNDSQAQITVVDALLIHLSSWVF